ncbi:MAG: LPXTG cell wall anchor domain-containing protein [Clostridia bacterium]|nr:LPXTG cell wall anchor domain-containing protein [Clostridia bacterium]
MMKNIYKLFSVLLCVTLLFSALIIPVSAADDTGSFYGIFENSYDDSPISNLKVKMTDVYDETIVYTTTTDSDGKYEFTDIPESKYLITIDSESYEVDDAEGYSESEFGEGFVAFVVADETGTYVKGGDTKTLTRINGSVTVLKYCAETTLPISGVVYELSKLVDDEYVVEDTCTTNEDGKIIIPNLAFGTYKWVEKTAEGYFVNEEETVFELSESHADASYTFANFPKRSVKLTKTDAKTNKPLAGVEFDLYQVNDSEEDALVGHYVTDENGVILEYLRSGEYYFVETKTLENYEQDTKKHEFACSELAPNVELFIGNTKFPLVSILKYKENSTDFVEGADLRISKDGKTIAEFTTNAQVYEIYLAPGDYVLSEVNCPKGYLAAEDISFTVSHDKENVVIMYDALDVYTITFHKTDATSGEQLEGAKMKLSCVETGYELEWVTTESAYVVKDLAPGTYVYEELEAPKGYFICAPVTFTLLPNQESDITDIKLVNDYTKVSISKLDKKTGEYLIGVKLHIEDANGNIVDSWTTTKDAYVINALPAGEYVVVEDTALAGYKKANKQTFTVTETGDVLEVKYYSNRVDSSAPKTGDSTNLALAISLLVLSAAALFVLGYKKVVKSKNN